MACWGITDRVEDAVPREGRYTYVTAHEDLTCAITVGGEIACWDWWDGVGRWTNPADDAPPRRYKAVSTTGDRTCALTEAGEAVCWGPSTEGTPPLDQSPEPLPGVYQAISVAFRKHPPGGYSYTTCALTEARDAVCWGAGNGRDPYVNQYPGSYAAALADPRSLCGLTTDGEAICRGSGGYERPALDGYYGDDVRYTAISESDAFRCAVTDAGKAVCEAKPSVYGIDSVMNPPDPGPGRFTAISVGGRYACALTDVSEAACWSAREAVTLQPGPLPGRFVSVSDGRSHTCALTEAGEAVCWGWNSYGQTDVPPGRYSAISAGDLHTCALTEAGEGCLLGAGLHVQGASGQTIPARSVRGDQRWLPHYLRTDRSP